MTHKISGDTLRLLNNLFLHNTFTAFSTAALAAFILSGLTTGKLDTPRRGLRSAGVAVDANTGTRHWSNLKSECPNTFYKQRLLAYLAFAVNVTSIQFSLPLWNKIRNLE